MINEGSVTNLKAQIMDTINGVASKIALFVHGSGFKVDAHYLEDIDDNIKSVLLEIQLGGRAAFPNSEVAKVEVYDDDNIKLLLSDNLARAFQVDNFHSFGTADEANALLGKILHRV